MSNGVELFVWVPVADDIGCLGGAEGGEKRLADLRVGLWKGNFLVSMRTWLSLQVLQYPGDLGVVSLVTVHL